jgi:hypothetical protein
MNNKFQVIVVTLLALGLSASVDARKYPDESDDGLKKVKVKNIDAAYWREGANLAGYDSVMIGDVDVSFRKNWQRDQNRDRRGASDRVTSEDMTKIRTAVAEGFVEMFVKELEDAGYTVVESAGENVLSLEPAIVDLDVRAPDIAQRQPGRVDTYTTSAGEMTLNLALYDSGSNSLIGRMIDERRAMDTGRLQFTNSITNRQEANVMFRAWAKALVRALDEAKSQ